MIRVFEFELGFGSVLCFFAGRSEREVSNYFSDFSTQRSARFSVPLGPFRVLRSTFASLGFGSINGGFIYFLIIF